MVRQTKFQINHWRFAGIFKRSWTPWVAWRFLLGRRGGRGRQIFFFSIILITTGVATLNTILAVMNGLQQGYIARILEIGSYHIRWIPDSDTTVTVENLMNIPGVVLAVPFLQGQVMLKGSRAQSSGALIRGVPINNYQADTGMTDLLEMVNGEFDLTGSGIVLGSELALKLGVWVGDNIDALNFTGIGIASNKSTLKVTGIFRCGYREYEAGLGFVSLDSAESFLSDVPKEVGLKLERPELDRIIMDRIAVLTNIENFISWRQSNRAFFGALRTEKVMMLLLLALIFVVVAVNIDQSLRRMATERIEDLAMLKALGASPMKIRIIFLRHGLMMGGGGGILGSILGVGIGGNVDTIIGAIRRFFLFPFDTGTIRAWSMGAYFQSSEIMIQDVITIFVLAVSLTFMAAIRASFMAARLKPSEVLRSE